MTLSLKKIYLILLLSGIVIFVPVLFLFSLTHGLNVALGGLIGIFPLVSWDLLGNLFKPEQKITTGKKFLFGLLALLKISVLGLIIYFLTQAKFFLIWPFIIGMTAILLVMIIVVLIYFSK
ncbi:MAG: hypothetical protein AAB019_01930 [Planctomycetota bacterium]